MQQLWSRLAGHKLAALHSVESDLQPIWDQLVTKLRLSFYVHHTWHNLYFYITFTFNRYVNLYIVEGVDTLRFVVWPNRQFCNAIVFFGLVFADGGAMTLVTAAQWRRRLLQFALLARLRDLHMKSVPFFEWDQRKQWRCKIDDSSVNFELDVPCLCSILEF